MSPWAKDPIRAEQMRLEARQRMLNRLTSKENHPMFGKKQPSSYYEKIEANRLRKKEKRLVGRDEKGRFLKGEKHPMKTEEWKTKSSEAHKGQASWNKGKTGLKKHSEITREKMSNSHIGKNLGKKNGNFGRPAWNRGKHHSEEQKIKLKIARRHRVIPKKDTKPERMMHIALSLHGIKFEKHKPIIGQPDIFIEPNLCIFIDGDFFHANPEKYSAETPIIHGRLAKDIWAKDIKIIHELSEMGYRVIRIWESKIKIDANKCAESIIKQIKNIEELIKNNL